MSTPDLYTASGDSGTHISINDPVAPNDPTYYGATLNSEISSTEHDPLFSEPDEVDKADKKRKRIILITVLSVFGVALFLTLLFTLIIPAVITALMGHFIRKADVEIYSLELLDVKDGVSSVHLRAAILADAPFSTSGVLHSGPVDVLVPDPLLCPQPPPPGEAGGFRLRAASQSGSSPSGSFSSSTSGGSSSSSDSTPPPEDVDPGCTYAVVGSVMLPSIEFDGLHVEIDIIADMIILDDRLLHSFMERVAMSEWTSARMAGKLKITAKVPIYSNHTALVSIDQKAIVRGFVGFDLLVEDIIYSDSTLDTLTLGFVVALHNPSTVAFSWPLKVLASQLDVFYYGAVPPVEGAPRPDPTVSLGLMDVEGVVVQHGLNRLTMYGTLINTPASAPVIGQFMADYVTGSAVDLRVSGSLKLDLGLPEPEPDAVATITVGHVLPALAEPLIEGVFIDFSGGLPLPGPGGITLHGQAKFRMPLGFDLHIVRGSFDAYSHNCDAVLDRVNLDWSKNPLLLPSRQAICVPISMKVSISSASCLFNAFLQGEELLVSCHAAELLVRVGVFDLLAQFDYGPVVASPRRCTV
ncbi:hypothetical protein H696_01039 [Fonticula alba]|uniref:Uncharacterized protein n=1 Tax=Fonticula alba TaxID=691883 RepID=A0A058ZCG5_FONAL|nr:hypothetical protein H696_01039 [Fonticula alba]KCV71623.1 hypothetical protein H696_01039 [Fonticula alba]|eukprot:XP_009493201.1 hypothetical protein H696_01039 [Fonticula alba]